MKYAVCEKPGQLVLKEKQEPVIKPGHALLKIRKVGICGTDLHAYAGRQPYFTYPRILGHELSAEVIAIDDKFQNIRVADQVIVDPYLSCGQCHACINQKSNCCESLLVLGVHTDGGMQEIISVPVQNLLPGQGLTLEQMAIIEPLSIGAHAVRRAGITPDQVVIVIGAGPIGIGIMALAKQSGATVIAMDQNPWRLEFAKKEIGTDFTVKAGHQAQSEIRKITGGAMASVVFDATGSQAVLQSGPKYMGHGGKFVLVGLFNGDLSFHHPTIHAKETSLLCSRNATRKDFEQVVSVMKAGKFPWKAYITHEFELNQVCNEFESLVNGGNNLLKAVISL